MFGLTTLHGHLLAGEERFAVYWNREDDSVWYVHSKETTADEQVL